MHTLLLILAIATSDWFVIGPVVYVKNDFRNGDYFAELTLRSDVSRRDARIYPLASWGRSDERHHGIVLPLLWPKAKDWNE